MQELLNIHNNMGLMGSEIRLKPMPEVLKEVQEYISKHYAVVLKDSPDGSRELIKSYIQKYLEQNSVGVADTEQDELCDLLYGEMTGFSFLSKYIYRDDVEELNINQWRDVKVSMCITGATSSGKTTLMSWILGQVPYNKRLVTIEQACREFDLTVYDKDGNVLNNVVHLVTRLSDDPKQNITVVKLLETTLTINPDCIAVAEMKGGESYLAICAANTGHAMATTIHANSCADTYFRMASLSKEMSGMDDSTLMGLATKAFPVVAFAKRLEDNSRHIMEICECEYLTDSTHKMRTLYRFNITDNVIVDGRPKIIGHYEKVNNPSEGLQKRLRENGMPLKLQEQIFGRKQEVHYEPCSSKRTLSHDPLNPREDYDNFGHMNCWHNRYKLGDKHDFEDTNELFKKLVLDSVKPDTVIDFVKSGKADGVKLEYDRFAGGWQITSYDFHFKKWYDEAFHEGKLEDNKQDIFDSLVDTLPNPVAVAEKNIILPLNLYDHSGISMSVTSFLGRAQHAEWDSGQVGWIYATLEDIQKKYGDLSPESYQKAESVLKARVEAYNYYLTNQCYGFRLYKDSKETDSNWGFLGSVNEVAEEISSSLPESHRDIIDHMQEVTDTYTKSKDYEDYMEELEEMEA